MDRYGDKPSPETFVPIGRKAILVCIETCGGNMTKVDKELCISRPRFTEN